jgi:pyruvate dehydrogenase E1 component
MTQLLDADPVETKEWLDSLHAVLRHQGAQRASYLIDQLTDEARRAGLGAPVALNTPYVNTIPPEREERAAWDRDIEHRIRSIIRWNAVAIILRANKNPPSLVVISPVFNRLRRCTTSASDISGALRRRNMAAT